MTDSRFLVAGGARVDAGKTTFSTGLLAYLRERGVAATGVKPRAGNDYWFDHDDVRASTANDRLYGKDARRLSNASDIGLPGDTGDDALSSGTEPGTPESINPIHRLWRPTPGRTGLLGEAGRTFLVDRVSTGGGPTFVVNGRAEDDGLIPERVLETLPIADARRVRGVPAFNELMSERHVPALSRLADRVRAATDPVVLESYADISYPLDVAVDVVAVVSPTRVEVFAGDRYEKAHEVASGSARDGQLEERTGDVTEMIEPLASVELPPVPKAVRTDPERVADAYEPAFEAVVDSIEP